MKIVFGAIILILVIFLGFELYDLQNQRSETRGKIDSLNSKLEALKSENEKLTADIEYFSQSDNLIKELKSLFNYRDPSEKLMIIVPEK